MGTPQKVALYDSAYANYESDVYRQVRIETYGEDLGQTSWVTADEAAQIPHLLLLNRASSVLELGCGAGKYALRLARALSCTILGVDINAHAVRTANEMAQREHLDSRARFESCDVAKPLSFADASFDAAFSNDAMCHIPCRPAVLREMFRILRPGGRLLFSDALVIGGMISHEEIAARSSIGHYVFSPPGENERLILASAFRLIDVIDSTDAAAAIAKRWRNARHNRRAELIAAEGERTFDGVQAFLSCVFTLTSERRLLRFVYLAEKET